MQFNRTVQNLIDTPDKCLEFIQQCLKPKQAEKKTHGEVFTPPELIEEMLSQLPSEVWKNPDLKWFDPAGGMGNFLIMVYLRLMRGLESVIPDRDKRKQHILENQLYMSEINPKNTTVFNGIFGSGEYKLNLYEGDTLELDPKAYWGVEHFDVIVGNPPWSIQVGPKKTEPIWDKFVKLSFKYLSVDGILSLIHPSGWRNIDGRFKTTQNLLLSKQLLYLEMHNEKDGLVVFNCESRYDWYILKNAEPVRPTKVNFQDGIIEDVNLWTLDFIPNADFKAISKLLSVNEDYCTILYNRSTYGTDKKWTSKTETFEYNHPCIYTVNSKHEPAFYYSSKRGEHFGVSKLIWSNGRISSVGSLIDINGDYGLTQFAYAIVDRPDHLPKIKQAFDSKAFRKLMESCSVGQLSINHKIISKFRKDFWKSFV